MNTPTLEQVLHDARQLSLEDQRALLALLRPPKSLEQIAAEQGIGPFNFDEARREAADIWPEDQSIDDFNAWLRAERRQGTAIRELH